MAGKALLVLGMTKEMLDPSRPEPIVGADLLIEAVSGEIDYFRKRDRPVVFMVPSVGGVPQDELVSMLHRDIHPDHLDTILAFPSLSAFFGSGLEEYLSRNGIESVTIVGVRTHVEVLYTAAGATMRGLSVTVPEPCVGSEDPVYHRCALEQIQKVLSAKASKTPHP